MWFREYSLCEILARSSRREFKGEIWLVQRQDRDYFRHCLVIRFDISRQSSGTCWKIASISATQVSTVFPATPPTLKKSSLLNNLASALFFLISLSVSSSSSLSSLFRSCLSIQRHKGALLALTSSSSLADCSYCCSYNQFWTWLTQFIQYAWRMASLASGLSLKNSFTQSSQERQHCCGGYQQDFILFCDSSVLCTAISLSISACGISSVKSKYAEKAV